MTDKCAKCGEKTNVFICGLYCPDCWNNPDRRTTENPDREGGVVDDVVANGGVKAGALEKEDWA
jgi:hypothetical protein